MSTLHQLVCSCREEACPRREEVDRALRLAKAVGWEVGYQRGTHDADGDLEPADNPYLSDEEQGR